VAARFWRTGERFGPFVSHRIVRPRHRPPPLEPAVAPATAAAAVDLRELFVTHAAAVRRFLVDLVRDAAAADEATQETFVRAHARLRTLADPARARAWLLGIARNVFLEELRRRRARPVVDGPAAEEPDAAPSPEQILLLGEARAVFAAALARLGEDRRAIFLLYSDHRLGYAEIAEVMGADATHVRNELHRARQALRAALGGYFGRGR
jgi:RNA polymerase sigma-70 factor (ECF subfamily)